MCLFELAGHRFGLRLESVREIVPMAALSRPPATPSILDGFLNLRGDAIPVLRTAAVLGLPEHRLELHTPLVVVHGGRGPLALLVSRVTGIEAVAAGSRLPVSPSDSFNGCIEGLIAANGDRVHLLSLDRLLLAKEQAVLASFQATETKRLREIDQERS